MCKTFVLVLLEALVTLSANELLAVIEHSVAAIAPGATPGSFPQVAGLAFSFDSDLPAGKRVKSLAIKDVKGKTIDVVVKNGQLVGDSNRIFRTVTLNFLATGGDGYPFPKRERVDCIQNLKLRKDVVLSDSLLGGNYRRIQKSEVKI
ncbi:5'-nucleotidase C-terminal domain-containing protein [Nostoc sp. CCCryo 231-06]|nr:5'-nucleotidase C-terminal domain-containing protein [Nostoc sp. CCCryo 231-06]